MNRFSKGLLVLLALALPAVAQSAGEGAKTEQAAAKVYKVNELFKAKDSIDKKQVTVTGKVMKVSSGIMGNNWIHLQDATVKPKTPDKDLTITTKEQPPAVGKIVTITGTAAVNKDFGSGYFYDLIVEQGRIH